MKNWTNSISPLRVCPIWCRFQVSQSRFQTGGDREMMWEEVLDAALKSHYRHKCVQLFWPLPDSRPSKDSAFICWMKSSGQQLLVPFSAPFLLTLGPQLQGFESVGLVLFEEKSAPPTDEGNPHRHMLKKFNTIMANGHLHMASVWNDSSCVYVNRAMDTAKTCAFQRKCSETTSL